ncbi:hypothetical protein GLYMA_12G162936v4 [Glycine max]|nr:hypothetical protein GLYMA_12G162936v4 [Glycine max]KAH1095887.1 hypothetical protein GYH30_057245 [Glycine max]
MDSRSRCLCWVLQIILVSHGMIPKCLHTQEIAHQPIKEILEKEKKRLDSSLCCY